MRLSGLLLQSPLSVDVVRPPVGFAYLAPRHRSLVTEVNGTRGQQRQGNDQGQARDMLPDLGLRRESG
jgi:hypothetical protein